MSYILESSFQVQTFMFVVLQSLNHGLKLTLSLYRTMLNSCRAYGLSLLLLCICNYNYHFVGGYQQLAEVFRRTWSYNSRI